MSLGSQIVVQLAKFNDKNAPSNSSWRNHTKESVTINQGDSIMVSKAFIDTRNLSSNNITILEDLPVELEMYFYIINNGNPGSQAQGFNSNAPGKVNWVGPNTCKEDVAEKYCYDAPVFTRQYTLQSASNIQFVVSTSALNAFPTAQTLNSVQANVYADGRPYLLCYSDNSKYTQTFRYTIPKGSYNPDELATLLTTAMAEVKKNTAFALNNNQASQWWEINPATQFLDQPFVCNTRSFPPLQASSTYVEGEGYTNVNFQGTLSVVPNNGMSSPSPKSLCFKPIITDCPVPLSSLGTIPNGPTIPAGQAHVGLTYTIVTLGNTNWYAMGFPAGQTPEVGSSFTCTAVEIIPPNPSPTPFTYYNMNVGQSYEIVNRGVNITLKVGFPVQTPPTITLDTLWSEMGQTDSETYINNVTQVAAISLDPGSQTNNQQNCILGEGYLVTEIDESYIDLSYMGGPPNIYGAPFTLAVGTPVGVYYADSFGKELKAPFTQTYDIEVGGLSIISQTVVPFGNPRVYVEVTGTIVPIQIVSSSALFIQFGVTYVITQYDPTYQLTWDTLGGGEVISEPWVAIRDGTAEDIVGAYEGYVVPSAQIQDITFPTLPTNVFTCTFNGVAGPVLAISFYAFLIGTGTVRLPQFVDGSVQETLNPSAPNYYMYPLKLNGNPGVSSYDPGPNGSFTSLLYDYGFPLVGATEIQLAYNDQLGKFQWSYIHSPIQQGVAPQSGNQTTFTEVVGIVNSFQLQPPSETAFISSTCKLTAQSGIMFSRMEPQSFWQGILGFSPNLIVTPDELGLTTNGRFKPIIPGVTDNRFTYTRFDGITSRGLLTTAMNFNGNTDYQNAETSYVPGMFYGSPLLAGQPTPPVNLIYSPVVDKWAGYELATATFGIPGVTSQGLPEQVPDYATPYSWNQVWFSSLGVTHPVIAQNTPTLITDTTGHYLLEISNYGDDKNGLLNDNSKFNCKAVVSTYYVNQGSFVTMPFAENQVYTHVGEPLTLNNFTIRILDPLTMREVPGLGPSSSIYLQIDKLYSPPTEAQVMNA